MDQVVLAQTANPIELFAPLVAIFAIFYLLVFRPQQKRMKEHQAMLGAVRRGDTVVTAGGIIGKVVRVGNDNEIKVEIADGVQVRVLKSTISEVRGKTEPVRDKSKQEAEPDEPEAVPVKHDNTPAKQS